MALAGSGLPPLGLCVGGGNDLQGQRRKEERNGSSWLSKGKGDSQERGNQEAGSDSGSGGLGSGSTGLGAKTRGELDVFMRSGEERLSYPARHSSSMCEFALPALT